MFGKFSEAIGIEDLRKEKINVAQFGRAEKTEDTYNEEAMIAQQNGRNNAPKYILVIALGLTLLAIILIVLVASQLQKDNKTIHGTQAN